MFEEASTSTSDEVSRPVVPASPMRAALFKLINKSGVGEARAAKIESATPIPASRRSSPRRPWEPGLAWGKSKRDWPRNVTHPATRDPFSHVSTAGESGESVNESR